MTPNATLSIPNALKRERPDDYYENAATIEWPDWRRRPAACHLTAFVMRAVVFKAGGHVALAKEFVRFLVERGLARALSRLRRRALPAADAEAARAAVLARPERPAPHGRGHAVPDPAALTTLTLGVRRPATRRSVGSGRTSGARRSTASPPRASAPSRRSTRRSPGSSRSSRSKQPCSGSLPGRLRRRCWSWRRSAPRPPTSWCGGRRATTPQEDEAVREIIAAFEQETGKQVELVLRSRRRASPDKIEAALEAGQPPDFLFGSACRALYPGNGPTRIGSSTSRTRSARSRTCSIRTRSTAPRCSTQRPAGRALYALPMGLATNHVHVWKSLLEQAGLHPRRHPEGVGGVLVLLVRPGAAGGAQGHWAATTSGASACRCRPRPSTPRTSSTSSQSPTRPTT